MILQDSSPSTTTPKNTDSDQPLTDTSQVKATQEPQVTPDSSSTPKDAVNQPLPELPVAGPTNPPLPQSEPETIEEPEYVRDAKRRKRAKEIDHWLELYPEADRNMVDMVLTMNEQWEQQYGPDYSAEELVTKFIAEDKEAGASNGETSADGSEGPDSEADPSSDQ